MRIILKVLACFFLTMMVCRLEAQTSGQDQLKQIRSTVIEKIGDRDYYIHTVKRGQTLYMISKAYGVEVNDLIRENPQVKEGIKADEKIRIPMKTQPVKPKQTKSEVRSDSASSDIKSKDTTKVIAAPVLLPCGVDSSSKKSVYNVALMLPLYLGDVESVNAEKPDRKTIESTRSFQFLPFYEGFRMALDSLENKGLSIKLYVYDVDKDTAKTRQLLKKPELKAMDLIVGLLYHRNFQIVSSFAQKNKITLINPISERSEIVTDNQKLFKLQPGKQFKAGQLAEYLAGVAGKGRILIIRSGQYSGNDLPEKLNKSCLSLGLSTRLVDGQQAAVGQLSKEVENYIVAFSEKPEYIIDFTRRLYELRGEYSITLFGLPDWSSVNGVETEYLVALKSHMMASSFVDYENQKVQRFVVRYQEIYKTDPELLAFQGFDVANYFLTALQQYGTNFSRCLNGFNVNTLQTRYNFSQTGQNGFENQQWVIFKYEGYKLIRVNF